MADLNLIHGTVTSSANGFLGPPAPTNPTNTNDNDVNTVSVSDGWGGGGGVAREYEWMTDLGDTYEVTSFRLRATASDMQPNYTDAEKTHTSYCSGSHDGTTWENIPYSAPTGATFDVTLTFSSAKQYRYFRYSYIEQTHTGFPSFPGLSIGTWEVEGEDDPVDPPDPGEPGVPSVPEPPEVARALVEIYVADPGAYRWGEALWGPPSVWSTAKWTNVTPQSVSADISWGASRADAGILAEPEAGLWTVITYDPDRMLDPGNAESPYAPEITYGLPIRLNHRGRTIRTGFVESVSYSLESEFGEIRATDQLAALAAVDVPEDVDIADTLIARARDVIAAVGLPITVLAPRAPFPDPPLAPWEPGAFKAWTIIRESALEALHIPYIDNTGRLGFAPWQTPLDRDAVVGSPELIDLVSFVSPDSLYSVVQAVDEAAVEVERRVTPLPRYGERVYRRTLATLDAGDWADIILEDRALTALRWRPGAIFPLDADSVEFLAKREIGELITIDVPEADPDVEVKARILGVRVRVVDLGGQAGPDWRWWFAASTAALEPLIEDEPASGTWLRRYLVDDDDSEYLYPDGVVGLE